MFPLLTDFQLPDDFFQTAQKYLTGLARLNESLNLISFETEDVLWEHVVDSLQILRHPLEEETPRVIDVGTGGGFPGIPLAIARPTWTVDLLDATQKKQLAVESLVKEMHLKNANTLWARAEDLARTDQRESYTIALSRAVGRLSTVLELTLPLVKQGGFCLLHRGLDTPAETQTIAHALEVLGGRLHASIPYRFPQHTADRFIVVVEKTHPTSSTHPRRPGLPAKRPL